MMERSALSFRRFRREDMPALYEIATSDELTMSWRFRGRNPGFDEFVGTFNHGVLIDFVACSEDAIEAYAVLYNHDVLNRFAYVAAIVSSQRKGTRMGRAVLGDILGVAFRLWDLRKVYAEVPDFIAEAVELTVESHSSLAPFAVEGVLKEHYFIDGRYRHLHIVSATREAWEAHNPREGRASELALR